MSLKAPATIEAVIACSAYPASGYLNWPAHMQYADVAAAAAGGHGRLHAVHAEAGRAPGAAQGGRCTPCMPLGYLQLRSLGLKLEMAGSSCHSSHHAAVVAWHLAIFSRES